jgi:hypothetical protein
MIRGNDNRDIRKYYEIMSITIAIKCPLAIVPPYPETGKKTRANKSTGAASADGSVSVIIT